MSRQNKTYTISEYGLLGTDKSVRYYNKFKSVRIDDTAFIEFKAFAKTDSGKDVLGFSNNGKYLQAKNYVGTIQTQKGYTLEILPKIHNDNEKLEHSKEIFLALLKLLYKLPNYKHINKAHFHNENMPLLEIFISMFLDEIGLIIKKGIKSDYLLKEENLFYLKGKLIINEQLKRNYIHKERFYVEYDKYSQNRAENRLLKTTLKYLLTLSKSFSNLMLIKQYNEHLYGIEYSRNIAADFRGCKTDTRGMKYYRTALIWAKVFLKKESFSSFSGETIAFAILYPMQKLFESYVEYWIDETFPKWVVFAQASGDNRSFVQKSGKSVFNLYPDFLIKKSWKIIIADAKWKLLADERSKSNISDDDFYRMFAYGSIYNVNILILFYPMTANFTQRKYYRYTGGKKLIICPLDMKNLIGKSH